jgi:flagellar hook assembly protein FlgD
VRVGAYANGAPVPISDGDMLAIRLRGNASSPESRVTLERFVDDLAGAQTVSVALDEQSSAPMPTEVVLHQNSPNPFNPETSIRFELPQAMRVRLAIYDVHGRLVRQLLDEHRDAGASNVEWNGTDDRGATVATGVYFYVLDAGGKRYQHKMVLLK